MQVCRSANEEVSIEFIEGNILWVIALRIFIIIFLKIRDIKGIFSVPARISDTLSPSHGTQFKINKCSSRDLYVEKLLIQELTHVEPTIDNTRVLQCFNKRFFKNKILPVRIIHHTHSLIAGELLQKRDGPKIYAIIIQILCYFYIRKRFIHAISENVSLPHKERRFKYMDNFTFIKSILSCAVPVLK